MVGLHNEHTLKETRIFHIIFIMYHHFSRHSIATNEIRFCSRLMYGNVYWCIHYLFPPFFYYIFYFVFVGVVTLFFQPIIYVFSFRSN